MPKPFTSSDIDLIELCDLIPEYMKNIVITVSDADNYILASKTNKHIRIGMSGNFESLREFDLRCRRKLKNELRNNTLILLNTQNAKDYISRFNPDYLVVIDSDRYLNFEKFFALYNYDLRLLHCCGMEYTKKVSITIKNCMRNQDDKTSSIQKSLLMY
tara:strand:+ start:349 stop:825 length:477 start_codon:yes stop_codon:yes gene_type:complete